MSEHLTARKKATQRVSLVSAIINIILSIVKLVVGFISNSAALIADGLHSVSDLLSDALVYFVAQHAHEEPDEQHPYGHGRFETAATLALGILLVLVALGIAWDAVIHLLDDQVEAPGQIALWAAAFSIIANEGLYWYTLVIAKQYDSELLKANAWHHRTDAISSVVVLIGVGGMMLGIPYLDAIAAILVALMILKIGWSLGWDALQELVDSSLDAELVEKAYSIINKIDGVRSVHMLRTRRHGPTAAADVHVQVSPRLTVSEGHMISQVVEDQLKLAIKEIEDVTVHIDPEDDEDAPPSRGLPLREKVLTYLDEHWTGMLEGHHINLHYLAGRIDIEVVLPIASFSSLEQTDELKQQLQAALAGNSDFRTVTLLYR